MDSIDTFITLAVNYLSLAIPGLALFSWFLGGLVVWWKHRGE